MKTQSIEIIIVDDESILRNGVKSLMSNHGISTIGLACDGQEALSILKNITPNVLLLDLEMPVLNGSKTLDSIRNHFPCQKVIILSSYHDEELIKDHLNRGANAFVSKNQDEIILASAIQAVYTYGTYKDNLPFLFKNPARKDGHYYKLIFTTREQEIIYLLCEGKSVKTIASEMFVSMKTTEGHLTEIYKKVKVKNKSQFLKYAIESGLQFLGKNKYAKI